MSYLVLARKYRPHTFDELVGQKHVTTTLHNALEAKKLAHAYIFSGPRGCGKTTTARILAMTLNCAKGPSANPCMSCPQCQEIASGNSPDDVLEIDGASNRGIDQIRELRDTVKYAPSRSRYRIYIIDEAHQITEAGFNALLKTLEEPPSHAVFMMATTEVHKIPGTIVSRCQRFQLKPIPIEDSVGQLKKITEKENLKVSEDALVEVAEAAHGSLRDALSLLDQVIAYSPDGVTGEDIRSLLGLLPRKMITHFAEVIQEGSADRVLKAIQKAVEEGFDLFQLSHDLMDFYHRILLWKTGAGNQNSPDTEELKKNAEQYDIPQLERYLQITSHCVNQMRRSESPRVTFELSALELAKKNLSIDHLLDRLENLEKSLQNGDPLKKKSSGIETFQAVPSLHKKEPSPSVEIKNSPPQQATPEQKPKAAVPSKKEAILLQPDQVRTAWVRMIEEVGKKKPSLETFLLNARWHVESDNILKIICRDTFQKQQLSQYESSITESLRKNLAGSFSIRFILEETPVAPTPAPGVKGTSTEIKQHPIPTAPLEEPDELVDENSFEETEEAQDVPETNKSHSRKKESVTHTETANIDPGIKKVLGKFPGKLKKIESSIHH